MSNFQPVDVVDRGSETQLQVGENLNYLINGVRDNFSDFFRFEQGLKIYKCSVRSIWAHPLQIYFLLFTQQSSLNMLKRI